MSDSMNPPQVTNWMIYEMLREFKNDTNRRFDEVDRRFEEIDRKFEEVNKKFEETSRKFEETNRKFDDVYGKLKVLEEKINDIHESREMVTVKFTRAWIGASFLIAIFASLTSLTIFEAF